jgi:hypothetical protein
MLVVDAPAGIEECCVEVMVRAGVAGELNKNTTEI